VSNIAIPTFETMLAVQMTVKAVCANAPLRIGPGSDVARLEVTSALTPISSRIAARPVSSAVFATSGALKS
jgi:hypothetical protein